MLNNLAALQSGEGEEIEKYFDLGSGVDYYILEKFCQNIDEGGSSSYMYKKNGDEKLRVASPGDLDGTFGAGAGEDGNEEMLANLHPNYIFDYLNKYNEFNLLVATRGNKISNNILDFSVNYINKIKETERNSHERNFVKGFNSDRGMADVETFTNQLKRRIEFLNSYGI